MILILPWFHWSTTHIFSYFVMWADELTLIYVWEHTFYRSILVMYHSYFLIYHSYYSQFLTLDSNILVLVLIFQGVVSIPSFYWAWQMCWPINISRPIFTDSNILVLVITPKKGPFLTEHAEPTPILWAHIYQVLRSLRPFEREKA